MKDTLSDDEEKMKSVEEVKVGVLYTVLKECIALQFIKDGSSVESEVDFCVFYKNVPFTVTEIKTLGDSPKSTLMQKCMMKILIKDNLETCYFTPETLVTFLENTIELQSS